MAQNAHDTVSGFFATKFGLSSRERMFLAGALLTAPVTAVAGVVAGLGVAAAAAVPHLWQRSHKGQIDAREEWEGLLKKREQRRAEREHQTNMKSDLIYRLQADLAGQDSQPQSEDAARAGLQNALAAYQHRVEGSSAVGQAAALLAAALEGEESEATEEEERRQALIAEDLPSQEASAEPAASASSSEEAAPEAVPAEEPGESALTEPQAESEPETGSSQLAAVRGMSDAELKEMRREKIEEASAELLKLRDLPGDQSAQMSEVIRPVVDSMGATYHPRWRERNEETLKVFGVLGEDEQLGSLLDGLDSSDEFYQVAQQRALAWCETRAHRGDKMSPDYLSEFIGYGYRDTFGEALRNRLMDELESSRSPQLLRGVVTPAVRERARESYGDRWAEMMCEPYFWCNLVAQTRKSAASKKARSALMSDDGASKREEIVMSALATIAKSRAKTQASQA